MSNITTGNPLIIDTAATILATGDRIKIKKIRFEGAADANECIIQNGAGVEKWHGKLYDVSVLGYVEKDDFGESGFEIDGLIVQTITSGAKVYIYLARQ
jgi:hypothetical protein